MTTAPLAVQEIPTYQRPARSTLRFRIVVVGDDGEQLHVVPRTLRAERWQAEAELERLSTCPHCYRAAVFGAKLPGHLGSVSCDRGESLASGGQVAHCRCQACAGDMA
jgi:hypothetical protein